MEITFTLKDEDFGAYPEPGPAHRFIPEWFKKLEQRVPDEGTNFPVGTVKKCVPFLEAMTAGYIIPIPVTMRVVAMEDGTTSFSWLDSSLDPIADHSSEQLPGVGEIYKFLSPWVVSVPDGYSVLVTSPLNHRLPFTLFSGVIDLDRYDNEVNFPFTWTQRPFDGVIHAGTPMAHLLPFKREGWEHVHRERTPDEARSARITSKKLSTTGIDGYREHFWQKKDYR